MSTSPQSILEQFNAFVASLPEHIKTTHERSLEHLKPWIESWLSQANIVTREEFEIQARILKQLQSQVKALQAQVDGSSKLEP